MDHMQCSHTIIEVLWSHTDKPGVRLMELTQLHNPCKSLPLLIENPRLLMYHCMIGTHEVEPSTPNLGGVNEDRAPGGILEIAHNFTGPVSGIFGDYANDLEAMVEMAINPPCQIANLAWLRSNTYSLWRKQTKERRACTELDINLRNSRQTADHLREE
jgi:hypothetical protein